MLALNANLSLGFPSEEILLVQFFPRSLGRRFSNMNYMLRDSKGCTSLTIFDLTPLFVKLLVCAPEVSDTLSTRR